MAFLPANESKRIETLRRTGLLDSPPEPSFDDLARIAAAICETPIALVTLVDTGRQWFKARVGIDIVETPRDIAFSAHAILGSDVLVVPDAREEPRFADNPLVVGPPHVRFYAGMPLVTADGFALGTLCVLDRVPRALTPIQLEALRALGRQTMSQIAFRQAAVDLAAEVTQRRTAEQRMATAIDASASGMVMMSPDGLIVLVNREIERLFGYPRSELIGQPIDLLVSERERVMFVTRRRAFVEAPRARTIGAGLLLTARRHDGVEFPVEVGLTPIEGGERLTLATVIDLTVRRAQEARLIEHARQLATTSALQRAIVESADFSIISTAPDGTIRSFNRCAERMLGYRADELVDTKGLAVLHDESELAARAAELSMEFGCMIEPGFEAVVAKARSGEANSREWCYVRKDGTHFPVLLSVTAIRASDSEIVGFLGIGKDITEDKKSRMERDRLAAIIEATPDFVSTYDLSGGVSYLNRSARRILGVPEDADLRSAPLPPYHPAWASRRLWSEAIPSAVARGSWQGESAIIDRHGREIAISEIVIAHENDMGDVAFLSTLGHDISALKQVERMKNEFISMVSHELRTPLTSIRGSLRILESGIKGVLPDNVAKLVHIASSNTERLIRLINDILDVEKIEAGKLELVVRRLDAAKVVGAALEGLHGVASLSGVTLSSSVPPGLACLGDEDRVTQVIVNLVSNAVKFSPPGATVSIVAAMGEEGRVRFSVVDQGPGIAEADRPKLFGKFQQLDSSDTRRRGGTGLGLAISRALVLRHGGKIGVISEVGHGSTFWFELPRPVSEQAAPPHVDPLHPPLKILVVDDDLALVRILDAYLTEVGFRVLHATALAEAKRIMDDCRPDAVLLDLHLPDGDGLSLLEWMRAHPRVNDVSVIILSGRSPDGDLGGYPLLMDWIQKPFDGTQLFRALRRAARPSGVARALVIEDDPSARLVVREQLEALGIECREAADGREALSIAQTYQPDLIVLDVGLPRLDGFEVVDILRRSRHRNTPLIVYSGRELDQKDKATLSLGLTKHLKKAGNTEREFLAAVEELMEELIRTPLSTRF